MRSRTRSAACSAEWTSRRGCVRSCPPGASAPCGSPARSACSCPTVRTTWAPAMDGWTVPNRESEKCVSRTKPLTFSGRSGYAGCAVLDIGTDRGSSHLWCGAPRGSRGGRSLAARWIGAGHSPHIVEREPELSLMHLRFVVTSRARSIVAPARPAYAGVGPKARCGIPARRRERARPGLGAGGPRGPRRASIPPAVRHALSPSTTRHL